MPVILYDIIRVIEPLAIIIGIPFGILCICKFITKKRLLKRSTGTIEVLNPIESSLYYSRGKSSYGPINLEELALLFHKGIIVEKTLIWSEGFEDWIPLYRLKYYGNLKYFKSCRTLDLKFFILGSIWVFFSCAPFAGIPFFLIGELVLFGVYYKLSSLKFHM